MPFCIRPFRRIPLCCPVTYQVEQFEGYCMVWNVTPMGWRRRYILLAEACGRHRWTQKL